MSSRCGWGAATVRFAVRLGAFALLWVAVSAPAAGPAAPASSPPQPILRLEPGSHGGPARRVAISADRTLLATASDDKTVRLWRLDTMSLQHTLRPPIGDGADGRLYGVAFHPQLPLIAVAGTPIGGSEARIHLYHPLTGEWMRAFDAGPGEVKRLAWSPDGRWLAVALAQPGGVRLLSLAGEPLAALALAGDAYGLDIAADGRLAATDTSGLLHLWRMGAEGSVEMRSVPAPGGEPVAVAFAPDGTRLALVHYARDRNGWVDILSADQGERLATWRPRLPMNGRTQAVAWTRGGATLALGGVRSKPQTIGREAIDSVRGFVLSYDATSGRVLSDREVATDAVTDLVAVTAEQLAYTSFDASWGVLDGPADRPQRARAADYVRRADQLGLSADGQAVQWQTPSSPGPRSFVLADRQLRRAALSAPQQARAPGRPGAFGNTRDWESAPTAQPLVQGRAQTLAVGEISRAVATIGGSGANGDVAWGTGHRLMRVAPDGGIVWSARPGAEVRAVHSSLDGRLVVVALADATIRWYRAADGVLLLSLFASTEGQWVLWSPLGHYDASEGAEGLIGWHLNSATGGGSEFFSISRFRQQLLRPDVIDRVLPTADPGLALAQADRARAADLVTAAGAPPATPAAVPAVPSAPAPLLPVPDVVPAAQVAQVAQSAQVAQVAQVAQAAQDIARRLPPTLVYKQPRSVRTRSATVGLEFGVVLRPGEELTSLLVRRDGVLQDILEQRLPLTADGKTGGFIRIPAEEGESVIHVVAANANGYSDPLTFVLRRDTAPEPKQVQRAKLFVLAVGVGKYVSKEIGALDLPSKDATDFADVLRAQDGRAYAQVEARVLTEEAATTQAIGAGLEWLRNAVGPGDTGMLFLAGHALNHPDGRYYFVSHDTAPRNVPGSALNEDAIRAALVRLKGRAVLFVDTCHAGNAIGRGMGFSRDMTRISNQLASPENGVIVFASSTGRQESQENIEWGNGAFTKAVVSGLRGGADFLKRGRVTFQALSLFVSNEVDSLTGGEQTPVLIAPPPGVPDFLLAVVGAARVGGAAPAAASASP